VATVACLGRHRHAQLTEYIRALDEIEQEIRRRRRQTVGRVVAIGATVVVLSVISFGVLTAAAAPLGAAGMSAAGAAAAFGTASGMGVAIAGAVGIGVITVVPAFVRDANHRTARQVGEMMNRGFDRADLAQVSSSTADNLYFELYTSIVDKLYPVDDPQFNMNATARRLFETSVERKNRLYHPDHDINLIFDILLQNSLPLLTVEQVNAWAMEEHADCVRLHGTCPQLCLDSTSMNNVVPRTVLDCLDNARRAAGRQMTLWCVSDSNVVHALRRIGDAGYTGEMMSCTPLSTHQCFSGQNNAARERTLEIYRVMRNLPSCTAHDPHATLVGCD
jgi:hypothetical protein